MQTDLIGCVVTVSETGVKLWTGVVRAVDIAPTGGLWIWATDNDSSALRFADGLNVIKVQDYDDYIWTIIVNDSQKDESLLIIAE